MLAIARSELSQTFRNRSVLISSFVIPLGASAFFILQHEVIGTGGLGYIACLIVSTVAAFSLYTSIVTILAARRQNLFLKRLRSTSASDVDIIGGMILPGAGLAAIQVLLMLLVLGIVAGGPDNVLLVIVATVAFLAMMVGLGLATAGVTHSPEHAQVTTLPISLGTLVVVSWVALSNAESLSAVKRLLPGGAATELLQGAWDGDLASGALKLLAPTLAWVAISVFAATKFFAWEPRR